MYLIYFDEVKEDSQAQDYYWIGGVAVDVAHVKEIEQRINTISRNHLGNPCLSSKTEFHAAEIYHRKNHFKNWLDPVKRYNIIGELLDVLNSDRVHKVYVRINHKNFTKRFSAKPIDEMAFMLFCEKADELMGHLEDIGMLIGDRESKSVACRYGEKLSNWRTYKTDYHLGTEISHLIDTVHFTESHLSRLLQLADIFIWCRQFEHRHQDTKDCYPMLMMKEIRARPLAMKAKRYRHYDR